LIYLDFWAFQTYKQGPNTSVCFR